MKICSLVTEDAADKVDKDGEDDEKYHHGDEDDGPILKTETTGRVHFTATLEVVEGVGFRALATNNGKRAAKRRFSEKIEM